MGHRTVISREGRRYRTDVCAALAAMRVERMDGRLAVRVTACPPDHRRRDLDNVQKALLDALPRAGRTATTHRSIGWKWSEAR
jgi:crossover junction endodeoxyribonuclease RusA